MANENQMTDQGFLDEIGKIIGEKLKLLPTPQPAPAPSPAPPAAGLSPWLTVLLSIALSLLLSFAARYGITPAPLPSLQSTPAVVVVQVPAGADVTAAKK